MEAREFWIVSVDCPKNVKGVYNHLQGQKVYLTDKAEWTKFTWTQDIDDCTHFASLRKAKEFAGNIKRNDMSNNEIHRGSEYYHVFGQSEATHMVKVIKVIQTFEVQEFPETDFQIKSDDETKAETDLEFAKYLELRKQYDEDYWKDISQEFGEELDDWVCFK